MCFQDYSLNSYLLLILFLTIRLWAGSSLTLPLRLPLLLRTQENLECRAEHVYFLLSGIGHPQDRV